MYKLAGLDEHIELPLQLTLDKRRDNANRRPAGVVREPHFMHHALGAARERHKIIGCTALDVFGCQVGFDVFRVRDNTGPLGEPIRVDECLVGGPVYLGVWQEGGQAG